MFSKPSYSYIITNAIYITNWSENVNELYICTTLCVNKNDHVFSKPVNSYYKYNDGQKKRYQIPLQKNLVMMDMWLTYTSCMNLP